jgi:hypothetical protein
VSAVEIGTGRQRAVFMRELEKVISFKKALLFPSKKVDLECFK